MPAHDWKSIQRKLRSLGFDPGAIDGAPGPKTKAAIIAFQNSKRMVADGIVGNKTYLALFGTSRADAIEVMKAAQLVAVAYELDPKKTTHADTALRNDHGVHVTKRCTVNGVEAYMLNTGCLLIPGSNALEDYLKFNLRVWGLGRRRLSFREEAKAQKVDMTTRLGFSRTVWHQGFLRHAQAIHTWIGKDPEDWPKMIIGHSLGAAAAQILSKTWAAPAVGFAAPRPRKSSGKIVLDQLSLSICRDDDIVCFLPSSFHHMGQKSTLVHANPKPGLNHNMEAYIDALAHPKPGVQVPKTWSR